MDQIEVIYPLLDRQRRVFLQYRPQMTALQAWHESGLEQLIAAGDTTFAVSGVRIECPAEHQLTPGDRLHALKALEVDPKESRRRRAEKMARQKK